MAQLVHNVATIHDIVYVVTLSTPHYAFYFGVHIALYMYNNIDHNIQHYQRDH